VDPTGAPHNFNHGWNGALRLLLPVTAIGVKLAALGFDRWTSVAVEWNFDDTQTNDWGLLRYRQRDASSLGDVTYADWCKTTTGGLLTECRTLRAGGALTLIAAIVAVLFSLILLVLTVDARRSLEKLSARAMGLWRWAYRAQVAASSTFVYAHAYFSTRRMCSSACCLLF
jgi:hypothetical protein